MRRARGSVDLRDVPPDDRRHHQVRVEVRAGRHRAADQPGHRALKIVLDFTPNHLPANSTAYGCIELAEYLQTLQDVTTIANKGQWYIQP